MAYGLDDPHGDHHDGDSMGYGPLRPSILYHYNHHDTHGDHYRASVVRAWLQTLQMANLMDPGIWGPDPGI